MGATVMTDSSRKMLDMKWMDKEVAVARGEEPPPFHHFPVGCRSVSPPPLRPSPSPYSSPRSGLPGDPDPSRETEAFRYKMHQQALADIQQGAASYHAHKVHTALSAPCEPSPLESYAIISQMASPDMLFAAANSLLLKLLANTSDMWYDDQSYIWTDPGTRIIWGPCILKQPESPTDAYLMTLAATVPLQDPIPSYLIKAIKITPTSEHDLSKCLTAYRIICSKLASLDIKVWAEMAAKYGQQIGTTSKFFLWQYITTDWAGIDWPEGCIGDIGYLCRNPYSKLLADTAKYASMMTVLGANHAAVLAAAMLSRHLCITPGGHTPYFNGSGELSTKVLDVYGVQAGVGWKLHVAPVPSAKATLGDEFYYFGTTAKFMANRYTWPGYVALAPDCDHTQGGLICDGWSYIDKWIDMDAAFMWGKKSGGGYTSSFEYASEGVAKYLMLSNLMFALPWGLGSDVFGTTGGSYEDWWRDARNVVNIEIGDDKLWMVWDIASLKCWVSGCNSDEFICEMDSSP